VKPYGSHADIPALEERVSQKLIAKQTHPSLDLAIYNYTPRAQFEKAWDDHILQARGLIVNSTTGEIVARPLPKFFNHDEIENVPWHLPFEVTTKEDGSMFIVRGLPSGERVVATRGSFQSTQAFLGERLLSHLYPWLNYADQITYIFELIHPSNRIVVDYGDREDLILLAMIDTPTGREIPLRYAQRGMKVVRRHEFDGIQNGADLLNLEEPNAEGFVVRFEDGTRVKVKFEEYKRLHRIVTGCSTKTIWEHLRDGRGLDELIDRVPDEFNAFVRNTELDLRMTFTEIEEAAFNLTVRLPAGIPRKEQAGIILDAAKGHRFPIVSTVAFAMLDGKSYAERIWRAIEPEWRQPFATRDAA
jgi:RNA ligase